MINNSYGALVKHQVETGQTRTLAQDNSESDIVQISNVNRHKIIVNKFNNKYRNEEPMEDRK